MILFLYCADDSNLEHLMGMHRELNDLLKKNLHRYDFYASRRRAEIRMQIGQIEEALVKFAPKCFIESAFERI